MEWSLDILCLWYINVAETMGKCGSHHCDGCGLCEIDEDIEENDDWFVSTECWD